MILKENEICPHSNNCPHNSNRTCMGSYENRNTKFTCDLVNNGQFTESTKIQRNPYDQTGKMNIIME